MTRHETTFGVWLLAALVSVGCSGAADDLGTAAQALDTPPLVARTASVDFGAVPIGTTATLSVALLNNGTDVIDVTDVTVTSAFPPDPCRAVVIQPCVRPGETTTLEISCAPTTAADFGGRVAVRYHSGSSDLALAVSLAGHGVAAPRR